MFKVILVGVVIGIAIVSCGSNTSATTADTRTDCGNRETKAMIVYMAKERTGAHNLSDNTIASIYCK